MERQGIFLDRGKNEFLESIHVKGSGYPLPFFITEIKQKNTHEKRNYHPVGMRCSDFLQE